MMTFNEIKNILANSIKDEWIKFKDPADKDYFYKEVKQAKKDDFDEVLSDLRSANIKEGYEIIQDMQDEFDNIND